MTKKWIFIIIFILLISTFTSLHWGIQKKTQLTELETQIAKEKKEILSYNKYRTLFSNISSNLNVKGFLFKDGTITPGVTLVERDLSFGSRMVLNTTDKFDTGEDNSTQHILIYENPKENRQVHVMFSYVPERLHSDMINCFEMCDFSGTTKALSNKMCITTVNYKNIIITVTQVASDKVCLEDNFTFIRAIQKLL